MISFFHIIIVAFGKLKRIAEQAKRKALLERLLHPVGIVRSAAFFNSCLKCKRRIRKTEFQRAVIRLCLRLKRCRKRKALGKFAVHLISGKRQVDCVCRYGIFVIPVNPVIFPFRIIFFCIIFVRKKFRAHKLDCRTPGNSRVFYRRNIAERL